MKNPRALFGLAVIAFSALTGSAIADDLVKMTIGQRGNWDTAITHLGEKAGIFKKHKS
jgi:NitT/TauT family transport system substrate-binding protein